MQTNDTNKGDQLATGAGSNLATTKDRSFATTPRRKEFYSGYMGKDNPLTDREIMAAQLLLFGTAIHPLVPGDTNKLDGQSSIMHMGHYHRAEERIQALCFNLAQTTETPQNLPVLLAFTLAMDLLEGDEYRQYWEAGERDPQETPVSAEEILAGFWRGTRGFGHSAPKDVPQAQQGAITEAAKALFALESLQTEAPPRVHVPARHSSEAASDAVKKRGSLTRV